MKRISKRILLDELENETERQLQEVIRVYQNLSEDVLLQPSIHGGWSIAQCFAHLNSYGQYYLPLLEKAIKGAKEMNEEVVGSTWLGNYFVRLVDPDLSSKKSKAIRKHEPMLNPEAYREVATFIHQQEQLLECLKLAKGKELKSHRIPTSILRLIRLSISDVVRFLVMHNERHLRQAKRNLQKVE